MKKTNAMDLAQATDIIWKDLFEICNSFSSSFSEEYQHECVSSSLLELSNIILYGPEIKDSGTKSYAESPNTARTT